MYVPMWYIVLMLTLWLAFTTYKILQERPR